MLKRVFQCLGIVVVSLALLTISPVKLENAQASIRHECNCRYVEKKVYQRVGRRTMWGRLKSQEPRVIQKRECDVKWHFNPFYHTGACD